MNEKYNRTLKLFSAILAILVLAISFSFILGIIPTGLLTGQLTSAPKIAVILTSDQRSSVFNDCISTGINMAVDDINQLGGINGRRLEVIFENDQNSSTTAENILRTLADSGVVEVISVRFLSNLVNISKEKKVILVSTTHSGPIFFNSTYLFRFRDAVIVPTLIMAEVAAKKLGLHEVAIIYSDLSTFSKDLFKERFEALGGNISLEINFTSGATNNYTYMIQILNEAKPKAIFFADPSGASDISHMAAILKEIKSAGLNITLFGLSIETSPYNPSLIYLAGDAAEGFIFISRQFAVHKNKYGRLSFGPDPCVVQAYESVVIPVMAMEKCGEDTECISNELHTGEFEGPTGKIGFREDGVIIRPYMIKTVENGKIINLFEYSLLENP